MPKDNNNSLFDSLQEYLDQDMERIYSQKTIAYFRNPVNRGRMNDPDGGAYIRGLCGDTMEMYLIIKKDTIEEIKFHTDGCGVTLACGSAATLLAKGKKINEVLKLSPHDLIDDLGGLPRDGIHCAILTISTLHKAIADYLLKTGY